MTPRVLDLNVKDPADVPALLRRAAKMYDVDPEAEIIGPDYDADRDPWTVAAVELRAAANSLERQLRAIPTLAEGLAVSARLSEANFKSAVLRANAFAMLSPNDAAYWTGFRRGLRRIFHGERFGTQREHDQWLAQDGARGRGYDDGLLIRWPEPEPLTDTEVGIAADAIMERAARPAAPAEPINQFRERAARYASKGESE